VCSSPASYASGPGFESWSADLLFRLKLMWFYLVSQAVAETLP